MEADKVNIYTQANVESDENTYYSNVKETTVKTIILSIDNTSETSGNYVSAGDEIIYNIRISNKDQQTAENVILKDELPQYVTLVEVKQNGTVLTENDYTISKNAENNTDVVTTKAIQLQQGETVDYEIKVNVDADINIEQAEELINNAKVYDSYVGIDSSEVVHILQPENQEPDNPEEPDDPNNPDNPDNPNNPDNPDDPNNPEDPDNPNNPDNPEDPDTPANPSQENRIISGTAWLDSNENGQRDEDETKISGVRVKILNIQTNQLLKNAQGNDIEATTNNNGFYSLNNIPQGQYIVIFEYDTDRYVLTDYEKEGVDSRYSSKVIRKELTINGQTITVGGTEIIQIGDSNIANLNIGLKTAKVYDLKLDKFVSRVIIQNSQGTTTNEFGESTLAKAEVDAKLINNTNVVVEYKIRVTNEGEVPAYVRRIVDYVSSEYTFSSELNTDWYEQDGRLYSTSLSNERIEPGESKDITLTLTKKMTENNTGLISNTAEIAESYNEQGIKDQDSTENNNATGEDDLGKADLILSIKTGQVVSTIGIILASIAIIGVGTFVVIKILMKKGKI